MAHIETAKQKHQITNPHSKMRGHANDIHLQSKTKESRKGAAAQRKIEGPGVSGGNPSEPQIVRPYDYVKGEKNFAYLGHFNKAEYVNQGHNVTPMALPGVMQPRPQLPGIGSPGPLPGVVSPPNPILGGVRPPSFGTPVPFGNPRGPDVGNTDRGGGLLEAQARRRNRGRGITAIGVPPVFGRGSL